MGIQIVKQFTFDAAHYLPNHEGDCNQLHGHTYTLEVGVTGALNPDGMVMDFKELKTIVSQNVLYYVDHSYLNNIQTENKNNMFPCDNPTAENMVMWIRFQLIPWLNTTSKRITFIRLWETPTSYAEWSIY